VRNGSARLVARRVRANHGWSVLGPWVGRYGTRYLARAIVARDLLGANTPEQAPYPIATADARGRDGSLTLDIQHDAPAGGAPRANWLPAPSGSFHLVMRLYEPKPSALSGRWKPPFVVRAGPRHP
jgi:hypothetical protein